MVERALATGRVDVNRAIKGIPPLKNLLIKENLFKTVPRVFILNNKVHENDIPNIQDRIDRIFLLVLSRKLEAGHRNEFGSNSLDNLVRDYFSHDILHPRLAMIIVFFIYHNAKSGKDLDINYKGIWFELKDQEAKSGDIARSAEEFSLKMSKILDEVKARLESQETDQERELNEKFFAVSQKWKNKQALPASAYPEPSEVVDGFSMLSVLLEQLHSALHEQVMLNYCREVWHSDSAKIALLESVIAKLIDGVEEKVTEEEWRILHEAMCVYDQLDTSANIEEVMLTLRLRLGRQQVMERSFQDMTHNLDSPNLSGES